MNLLILLLNIQETLPLLTFELSADNMEARIFVPRAFIGSVYMKKSDDNLYFSVVRDTVLEGKHILTEYTATDGNELRAVINHLYQENV